MSASAADDVFGRLVHARLRAAIGSRVAWAVSGGAPLSGRLGHFFRGAGITFLEGWGLTETARPVTFNLLGAQRIGSVGLPLPPGDSEAGSAGLAPRSGVNREFARIGTQSLPRPASGAFPADMVGVGQHQPAVDQRRDFGAPVR